MDSSAPQGQVLGTGRTSWVGLFLANWDFPWTCVLPIVVPVCSPSLLTSTRCYVCHASAVYISALSVLLCSLSRTTVISAFSACYYAPVNVYVLVLVAAQCAACLLARTAYLWTFFRMYWPPTLRWCIHPPPCKGIPSRFLAVLRITSLSAVWLLLSALPEGEAPNLVYPVRLPRLLVSTHQVSCTY